MKSVQLALSILLVSGTGAFAQTALDADGDGMVTLEEVHALYPDVTAEDFAATDIDDDGMLTGYEVTLAVASGIIPAQE
jgi:hypothetical protein